MYDFILRNAILVDGRRTPPRRADVCIKDGEIAALPVLCKEKGTKELDVSGKIVAPGFIDIHTHSDTVPFNCLSTPQSKLFQGVTLEITGNCGISALPLNDKYRKELIEYYRAVLPSTVEEVPLTDDTTADYRKHVSKVSPAINYGVMIGHGSLRGSVMGFGMRAPTPEEQAEMEAVLDRELSYGAFGMSLGLIYPPSSYSKLGELIGLAQVLKRHEAILSVHMRNEGPNVFDAVREMIEIARKSGVHVEISHLKLMGKAQWGRANELLSIIHAAQAEGLNITCDQYPYPASSTGLSALAPGWAHDGGPQMLMSRLEQPTKQLLEDIGLEMNRRGGAQCVMVVSTHQHMPEAEGKSIAQLALARQISPEQMVVECLRTCNATVACIYFSMDFGDVCTIMKDMRIAVGSDGSSFAYNEIARACHLHPRNFGTFPRFFQTIREQKLMPLEDAVYKVSGLPAEILGLTDRGIVKIGKTADLTVFDFDEIEDRCTYTDAVVKPKGVYHVFVNGVPALLNGEQTSERAGCVLCHQ